MILDTVLITRISQAFVFVPKAYAWSSIGLPKKYLWGLLKRDFFTQEIPFLSANQRRQSTEETAVYQ